VTAAGATAIRGHARVRPSAIDLGLFAALAVLQIWLILTHAPWIDEGQALLIARAPFAELAANLKYEGHGALWYLWLGSVDRVLGGSRWSMAAAQAPVSLGLLVLIWFRSPFPRAAKLLLSLSYFIVFEYGVISREYSLGALLLLGAISERRSTLGWGLLALAANTSVHDALGAGVLGAVFFVERRNVVGPLILASGFAVAALTVFPIAHDLHRTAGAATGDYLTRFLRGEQAFSLLIVPSVPALPYHWRNPIPGLWGVGAGLLAFPLGLALARGRSFKWGFALLYAGLLVLALWLQELLARDVGVLFVFLVCGLWVALERGEKLRPLAWMWMAVLAACGLPFVVESQTTPFTHSLIIADWIRAHGLADETWGAWPGKQGTMISAEFGRPTINLEKECLNTFLRWDYPHDVIPDPMGHIRAAGARHVISETPLPQGRLLTSYGVGGGWEWPVYLYAFDAVPRLVKPCR
jgi:hypothetical protein